VVHSHHIGFGVRCTKPLLTSTDSSAFEGIGGASYDGAWFNDKLANQRQQCWDAANSLARPMFDETLSLRKAGDLASRFNVRNRNDRDSGCKTAWPNPKCEATSNAKFAFGTGKQGLWRGVMKQRATKVADAMIHPVFARARGEACEYFFRPTEWRQGRVALRADARDCAHGSADFLPAERQILFVGASQ